MKYLVSTCKFLICKLFANVDINWAFLKRLDNHKIISSSPIWLFLLSLASVFIKFGPEGSKEILTAPFILFFTSAILVLHAKTIFIFNCPEIVYEFNKFQEFVDSGKGTTYLNERIQSYDLSLSEQFKELILKNLYSIPPAAGYLLSDRFKSSKPINEAELFWYVHKLESSRCTKPLFACYLSYLFAFLTALSAYFYEFIHIMTKIL